MAKILCSPSKYVQGAGEMKKLGEYAQKYGKKSFIVTQSPLSKSVNMLRSMARRHLY